MAKAKEATAKFAFQCKNCGAVEPAEAAGENPLPRACHICRHGVRFELAQDGTGFTVIQEPENWIILADLSDTELKKDFHRHGLKRADIEEPKHRAPKEEPKEGAKHTRTTRETVGAKDKHR